MAENKKYYYMKLKDNFFETEEMMLLESMEDGIKYSNILLKMYLKSVKNNGCLMLNGRIPYNTKMLASVTRHSVGDVEKAISVFRELGLIEIMDSGAIYMSDIQNYIGTSSTEADRKREYRRKIEEEKSCGTFVHDLSQNRPPEIEIEKDIDIETEINNITLSKDNVCQTKNVRRCLEEWNKLSELGIKPVSKMSSTTQRYQMLVARIKEYGVDTVIEAINKIRHSKFLQGKTESKRSWVITFDWFVRPNNLPKVLDGNYDDVKNDIPKEHNSNTSGGWQ